MATVEDIIEQEYHSVHRFLRVLSGSQLLADDLTQETFVELMKRGTTGIRDPRNYVRRVAYTRWARYLSTRSPSADHLADFDVVDRGPSVEESCERAEALDRLRFSMLEMPPDLRAVVILVSLMDCSFVEAAEVLATPRTTLVSRHRRALEWLRWSTRRIATRVL
ncbi:MAG: sigma-70 family RNA polymerase sigma factor [Phycisphaerae bacterium]|nr:sigma-70 family RNA polymerase sigma factor [Phycisphaerae bacterium]